MFRLGSFLFLPAYITVTMYRVPFASEKSQGDFALMSALTLSTYVVYSYPAILCRFDAVKQRLSILWKYICIHRGVYSLKL